MNSRKVLAVFLVSVIRCFVFIWDVLTYPVYVVLSSPVEKVKRMNATRTKVISRSDSEITVTSLPTTCSTRKEMIHLDTVDKIFRYICVKFAGQRCLGWRTQLAKETVKGTNGKPLIKVKQSDHYEWITYNEVFIRAETFGRGLRAIGVQPTDRIVIYADTKAEWFIAAMGCFMHNIAISTIYTNLGSEGVAYGIRQTGAKTVITSQELLPKLLEICATIPSVENVVYIAHPLFPPPPKVQGQVWSHGEVLSLGQRSTFPVAAPTESDVAVIMYTSGSTGNPKGVVLTHRNLATSLLSGCTPTCGIFGETRSDHEAYIAYLPLAHIFELTHELFALMLGIRVGYSSPNTLSDASTMIPAGDKGDINVLKPTFMPAVPLILDRIYKGISAKITNGGAFTEAFFQFCFQYRLRWIRQGFDTPLMNRIIFRKLRASFGGNIVAFIGGGAPLSEDVHDFLRTCLNVHVCVGYGLTETVGGVCICDVDDLSTGNIGRPLPDVRMRLVNWEEGGYTVTDPSGPRGEIVIGGGFVAQGYYNMPEKTEENFYMEDGEKWFRTGDIGQLMPNGTFRIIDRKKDLVKLPLGEYVSLGKVEACLKVHPIVESVCVHADPMKNDVVALVVPDNNALVAVCAMKSTSAGHSLMIREEMCLNREVVELVHRQLIDHAKNKLQKFEIPKRIKLIPESWLPETGLVTAAMKLRRRQIQMRYRNDIEEMFSELGDGVATHAAKVL